MKINVIKVIDSAEPEQSGQWSRKEVNKNWRLACLYEINRKPVLEIVNRGKHVKYMVRR